MHKLFSKLFLSFWIALTLLTVVTIISASYLIEKARSEHTESTQHAHMMKYLEEAQDIADYKGIFGLKQWLREIDNKEMMPLLMLNNKNEDLLNRKVPRRILTDLTRLHRRLSMHVHPFRTYPYVITIRNGSEYRLVPDYSKLDFTRIITNPKFIFLPLLIAAIVSSIVSLILARYLASPIAKLRAATHNLATGDLSKRVTPSMGTRKDELADLAKDFDSMAEKLERLLNAQKQLVSDVSHELRSPLARLQVAIGLARHRIDNNIDPELDRMEREVDRLDDLIGQLLSLAKLESGAAQQRFEEVNLTSIINSITEDAAYEAASSGCKVIITDSISACVNGDPRLLQSAIENVVRNAIKYTNPETTVEISLAQDPDAAESFIIRVRDHGHGIPDDMLPQLFEPFVRVGEARDRNSGGYGLGLAIADRAIRIHGGTISAHNEPDGGICVEIRLHRIECK
jgi:two-component system sensor histidine kinase CpxA